MEERKNEMDIYPFKVDSNPEIYFPKEDNQIKDSNKKTPKI